MGMVRRETERELLSPASDERAVRTAVRAAVFVRRVEN